MHPRMLSFYDPFINHWNDFYDNIYYDMSKGDSEPHRQCFVGVAGGMWPERKVVKPTKAKCSCIERFKQRRTAKKLHRENRMVNRKRAA